jgi:hypothetical protein
MIQNPYSLLPPFEIYRQSENVRDGTGAMRAYQEMLYGDASSDQVARREYERALLRYCRVDTLAMVLIWEHWMYLHAGYAVTRFASCLRSETSFDFFTVLWYASFSLKTAPEAFLKRAPGSKLCASEVVAMLHFNTPFPI